MTDTQRRYTEIIQWVFERHYKPGMVSFEFERPELEAAAAALGFQGVRNLGDVVYAFRYRNELPEVITATAPEGKEWIIAGAGRARYRFRLVAEARVLPDPALVTYKVPNSTPEIITMYAKSDEQALLAKVRYNRLVDIFLQVTAYSVQNHLRTTVRGIGQIEIDEVYVAVDSFGAHYIVPVQAKGGRDQIGVQQTTQDLAYCQMQYPGLAARPVAAQFMADDVIALIELSLENDEVKKRRERHYRLVPGSDIGPTDLDAYRADSGWEPG